MFFVLSLIKSLNYKFTTEGTETTEVTACNTKDFSVVSVPSVVKKDCLRVHQA